MIAGNADALDVVLMVIAGVLALAALPAVHRMIVGPTILDRAVASDMLIVLVVAGMALYTAATGTSYGVAPMLGLTALAFVGTLAVARFVSRDRVRSGVARPPEDPDALQSDTLSSDPPSAEAADAEGTDAKGAVEEAVDAAGDGAELDGAEPDGAEPGRAEPGGAELDGTARDDAESDGAPAVRAPFTDDGPGPHASARPVGPHDVAGGAAPRLPGPAAGSHASGLDVHESDDHTDESGPSAQASDGRATDGRASGGSGDDSGGEGR
ncbi:monovalent cation/H+ antiporter complex subunit F [Brachybacterium sp. ACRRE]|uniref:monovalent cation/H+ antiporter complex subunit F n=1 Tax=Brachybacterium sp. ACRRE TaxID=2918184 RepID=UPI001EF24E27|nr:monovalent cation/H+ antiporter complex subunit F [Brachybacterium sp. ACRRE]MCG7308390.1 monovalent cation/H+ antiporter complex subunit F [Brachybacterium sp. ACRRE]